MTSTAPAGLLDIVLALRARIDAGERECSLHVSDPDLGRGRFPGERFEHQGRTHVHRPFAVWVELAERLGLRLLTPRASERGMIELRFELLDRSASWQLDPAEVDPEHKYAPLSGWSRVSKLEDPGVILDVAEALERAGLPSRPRILDLGINTGDEFALLVGLRPELADAEFVGIDHSEPALTIARERFGESDNFQFITADLATLPELEVGRFDLVLAFATLQSPGVDDRMLLRHIVQDRLTPRGAVMIGVPNCRYIDGERLHGAKMRNLAEPDGSLMITEVAFYKRYLQQHRKRVFVTGKDYMLVTGVAFAE